MMDQEMEKKIARELRDGAKADVPPVVYDRVWARIEGRLAAGQHQGHWTWRPWGHPVRWVALAAGLCVALTGYLYMGGDDGEMANYLLKVSNPTASMTQDQDFIKVSTLLTESNSPAPDMSDDVRIDSLSSDEIFL